MHILAVSGMHVGIIYILLNTILIFSKNKYGKVIKVIIIVISLWLYAFITGLTPSVCRAALMFSFIAIGSIYSKQNNTYNSIFSSAFILLIINPFNFFSIGFQLSYVAVLGIVALQPIIYKSIYVKNYILDKTWSLFSVTLAAQIATTPLTLYYFHNFSTYFWLSNLIIVPMIPIITYLAILILIVPFLPIIQEYTSKLLIICIDIMNFVVAKIEVLPMYLITNIYINKIHILLMYSVIVIVFSYITIRKNKMITV